MSVIELDLWINFQVLKSTYQQLRIHTATQIRELGNQIMANQSHLVSRLLTEISSRDEAINLWRKRCEKLSEPYGQQKDCKSTWYSQEKIKSIEMELLNQKLREVETQNKEYETEFAALINEMKTIKLYVEELKRVKSVRLMGGQGDDSPARQLEEEDQILTKISSLKGFQKLSIGPFLDTIREVTEMSAHSEDCPQQQRETKEFEPEPFNLANHCQIAESQSFQCTNEIQDITNILFDNSSQEMKDMAINRSQCYETFEHSLSVLKNYCGSSNDFKKKSSLFSLPDLPNLTTPTLKLKQIVSQRHLIFHDGYIYTGNTVRTGKTELKPMGFGQLYYHNCLIYCGNWKNGVFNGWGKMYFNQGASIRSYNGKWEEGIAKGPSSLFFWNNDKFLGSLQNGQVQSDGVYYQNGKPLISGYWQNNHLTEQQL